MRYFFIVLIPFITAGCSAQNEYNSGTITEMDVFENTGCIMLKVQMSGTERQLLIQGLSVRDLKRYDDDVWHTWSPFVDLIVNVTTYHHTYPDNGLSDGLAYDEVEIWSSQGTDHRNANHIAPALSAMLPFGSCRFVGSKDRTMVWVGAPEKDYHMKGAILQFTSSIGHDFSNPVHQGFGP